MTSQLLAPEAIVQDGLEEVRVPVVCVPVVCVPVVCVKLAVTDKFAITFLSVLVAVVTPSLQDVNVYPVFDTAVTDVPFPP